MKVFHFKAIVFGLGAILGVVGILLLGPGYNAGRGLEVWSGWSLIILAVVMWIFAGVVTQEFLRQ